MKIYIEDLRFRCIIGILDFEREKKQEVILNIEISYRYKNNFINYADVAKLAKKTMKKRKFLLIEDALEDLSKRLKDDFSDIKKLKIKITKPQILPDTIVSVENIYKFNS